MPPISSLSALRSLRARSFLRTGLAPLLTIVGHRPAARRTLCSTQSEPFAVGATVTSDTGQDYRIDEVSIDRRDPLLCVYRASAGDRKYIVKNLIPGEFDYQLSLQKLLKAAPNVRTFDDTVRRIELFIYPFLAGNLLRLGQKPVSAGDPQGYPSARSPRSC